MNTNPIINESPNRKMMIDWVRREFNAWLKEKSKELADKMMSAKRTK